ncbi:MAG: hypothetical protein QOD06_1072 [Candidatus Binatota bacterium]|jgi:Tfp pilus assembly protein PilE|nr:hypothetical protein [Candidatus Binatota bacterium]
MAEAVVGLAIILVVTLLVLPVYFDYRRKAVDMTMRGVLHNAKKAMEAFYATHSSYQGATVEELRKNGLRAPGEIDLQILKSSPDEYEIRACAEGGSVPALRYESDQGSTIGDQAACRPAAPPAIDPPSPLP